ncbi:MAG: helix-turn-helix domain-containing protein [Spirochaetes bacterium]|nr:helix-turn-helix domain-containing protein [Spirochaetota bacterium]
MASGTRKAKSPLPIHRTPRVLVPPMGGLRPEEPFSVGLHIRPKPWIYSGHSHTFHEIAYVVAGSATHRIQGRAGRLGPGSLYALSPGVFHSMEIHTELAWYNLLVTVEALPDLLVGLWSMTSLVRLFYRGKKDGNAHTAFVLAPEERSAFEAILAAHARVKHGLDAGVAPLKRHLFMALLIQVARCHLARQGRGEDPRPDDAVIAAIGAVEAILARGGEASVAAVVRAVKTDVGPLSSRFQRMLGCTLPQYLLRRKIQKSLLLLGDGARVGEIASRFGFADAAHFSRTFKEHIGRSPRDYLEERQAAGGRLP